jgi:hypothetical protein
MQAANPVLSSLQTARPWYTHRWPWLLMLGPFVVVVAGIVTGYLAFSRQDALVVDDYYMRGKAINQDLRRDRVAASLGLDLVVRYDPAAGVLKGRLLARGVPQVTTLNLHLAHATLPEKDLKFIVKTDVRGEFVVALPMLERARWQVLLESELRDWRLTGPWKWPHAPAFEVKADAAAVS